MVLNVIATRSATGCEDPHVMPENFEQLRSFHLLANSAEYLRFRTNSRESVVMVAESDLRERQDHDRSKEFD